MSFSLTQTQITELIEYVQKSVGEEGYIDPSEIYIAVQHPSMSRAMKFRLVASESGSVMSQRDRISSITTATVSVSWDTPFAAKPVGWHKVYREVIRGGNKRMYDVLLLSEEITTTGMTLVIDSSEDLTGVIVEYNYDSI